jgi:hypothetical protein
VLKPDSGDVGAHDHVTVLHLGLFLNFQERELGEVICMFYLHCTTT